MTVRVLGVDPGFAHIGLMGVEHLSIGASALFARAVVTKPGAKKRGLRQPDDDTRRLEIIRAEFGAAMDETSPAVVAMERVPRIPRNPKATRQCALAWSVMWTIARERGIPVLVCEVEDIKYEVCKNRGASKDDMVKALKRRFITFDQWPDSKNVEHVADAGGAALLARSDPVVEVLLQAERGRR